MKVLIIGKGGREHTLAWKIKQSPLSPQVYVAPGNFGMVQDQIETIDIAESDFDSLEKFIKKEKIDLVVVGPEGPLSQGLTDRLSFLTKVWGPDQAASQLEASKVFAKRVMLEAQIPTGNYFYSEDLEEVQQHIERSSGQVVLKLDGLAAGKGVAVCSSIKEALEEFDFLWQMKEKKKIKGGILVEEKLQGREVSLFALCHGEDFIPLGTACDYKRIYESNKGPNTGGMGCYSPAAWLENEAELYEEFVVPTLKVMNKRGIPFTGFLFVGLMMTEKGPKALEYNVRMGDPETQVLMPLLKGDLLMAIDGLLRGEKTKLEIDDKQVGVHVVMSASGYPGYGGQNVRLDDEIKIDAEWTREQKVFFGGVKKGEQGLMTAGGRVLGVTATASCLEDARIKAYEGISKIHFKDSYHRKDIGEYL